MVRRNLVKEVRGNSLVMRIGTRRIWCHWSQIKKKKFLSYPNVEKNLKGKNGQRVKDTKANTGGKDWKVAMKDGNSVTINHIKSHITGLLNRIF